MPAVASCGNSERGCTAQSSRDTGAWSRMHWVYGRGDIQVTGVSDEHGRLQLGPAAPRMRIGERVLLIPGHCDPTINLHDWYVAVRRRRVEALWPITARGASR